ncbi:hypothetical protein TCSYLVIO_010745 [Trypanosoma cruzi]|nr:hypothetical protein TCSYLVIO_010745 [Trypanosoma cruzi]
MFVLSALCRCGHTHGQSKIISPSTIQNQHRHLPRRKDLSCQHGPPAALPSTLKHGTVHALIFRVFRQPFASHILRRADVHKSTPQKATVIAHALAMSVGVRMDPLLTCAGRRPAAVALVPVPRLQHGKEKTAYSRCSYSHQQHQRAVLQPSFLSTSRNAEKRRGTVSQQCHNPRTHVGSTREDTQTTSDTLHMSSEHHSDTPRHAKQKYSSLHAPPHTIAYSMHHARQQLTRGQTNVLRIIVIHVLQWEANKRDELPNNKRVPRLAASQRNAATQMNSVLMPSASHLLPQKLQEN